MRVAVRAVLLSSCLVVTALVTQATTALAIPVARAAAVQEAPAEPSPGRDLDVTRLSRPVERDSTPGRATGLPLAIASVVILVVTIVVVLRARGARQSGDRRQLTTRPTSAERQLSDGSGGQ
ncbi:MAG: hypothetical protein WHS89_05215 [Acidimicrobiales bacterium]|jgi:hypothetical protein